MAAIPCRSVPWVFQTQHFSTALVATSTYVRWPVFPGLTPHRTATQQREEILSALNVLRTETRFVVSYTSVLGNDINVDCSFTSANTKRNNISKSKVFSSINRTEM